VLALTGFEMLDLPSPFFMGGQDRLFHVDILAGIERVDGGLACQWSGVAM